MEGEGQREGQGERRQRQRARPQRMPRVSRRGRSAAAGLSFLFDRKARRKTSWCQLILYAFVAVLSVMSSLFYLLALFTPPKYKFS
mmetsp:Transcript_8380/g.20750  ORF Transcript_8380/g.20750 Transcript_8380/m.20750 type:complete len:86 (-) Transcript_8380:73-330(-)